MNESIVGASRRPPSDDQLLLLRIREIIAEASDQPLDMVDPDVNIYTELGTDSLGGASIFIDIAYEFGTPEPKETIDYVSLDSARKILAYVRLQESLIA